MLKPREHVVWQPFGASHHSRNTARTSEMDSSRLSACPGARNGTGPSRARAFGPLRPDNPGRALPGSISRPDVRAWRSEIDGSQSALRDLSAIECAYAKTVRNCSISDVLGGKPPLKIPDIYRSRVRKQPLVIPYSYQSAATHTHLLERRYEFGDDGLFALLARRLSGVTSTQGDVSCAADAFLRASVSADLLIELTSQHLSRVSRAPHARVT